MMTVVMGLGQGRLKSVDAQRRPPYGTWMPGSRGRPPHQSRGAGAAATGAEAGGGRRCETGAAGGRRLFLDFLNCWFLADLIINDLRPLGARGSTRAVDCL